MKTIHPAIAEHVMEENARLREVLRCIADLPMDRCSTENDYRLSAAKAIALGALSQQAELVRSPGTEDAASMDSNSEQEQFTAVDMATAAAQGFRDGQEAVAAPAQDEREVPTVVATAILGGLFHGGSGPELGEIDIEVCTPALETIQCETVNGSDDVFLPLMTVAQHERIVAALTRPAQTEQQPIRLPERKRTDHLPKEYKTMTVVRAGLEAYNRALDDVAALNAAPIAQTAPQPEQSELVVPRTQLERIERRLTDWLELNCCECESGHSCGRNEVAADRDAIRAALSTQGPKP